jgi:two-component system sensor histidine kinase/response regulator
MEEHDGTLVLLAEDNEVNQLVAICLLEKHGFRVDVAANGALALEMCARGAYEAVFMDCQMPGVDGYEATAEIRRRERPGQHMPIIAMTANVMDSDRARCLAAGMDDFVGKPIDPAALGDAIARSMDGDHPRNSRAISAKVRRVKPLEGNRTPLLDRSVLDAAWEDDTQTRQHIVGVFADESKAALADIERAIQTDDSEAVQRDAHRLKNLSASVGAVRMAEICERLCQAGSVSLASEAPGLLGDLKRASKSTLTAWYAGLAASLARE